MRLMNLFALFLIMLCVISCSLKEKESDTSQHSVGAIDSTILATVNNASITEAELDLAIEKTLGKHASIYITPELEDKILQSLISSKAIAQASESSMSAEQIESIQLKTAAYREELLVKHYLQSKVTPEPVTPEMVKKYYIENQQLFTDGTIKTFEYIQVIPEKNIELKLIENSLKKIEKSKEWKYAGHLLKKKYANWQINYKKASLAMSLIKDPVKELLTGLKVGEVAPVKSNNNIYTIVKLISEKPLPIKPLSEVSAEIRKKIAPFQLKQAIKEISDQSVKNADIKVSIKK